MPNFAAWFAWRRRRIMARQGGGFDPNVFIRPAAAALIYTTYAPAITGIVGYAGAPASASLQYTTYQPTVSAPASVSPGAASLIYTAYQPTVSTGAAGTLAQQLVDDWASGGAGSDGFAMVFEDSGGTDAPSIYVKDSGTPANDTDINLTDDFDAFNAFLTYTSPSPKIVRQSDGNLKYCAHNLYLNSASPANQSITVTSGATYAVTITGSVSVTASGAATGTWTAGTNTFTAATTTLTLGSTSGSGTVHVYRTPADTTYLATTGSIRYALPIQHDSSNNAEGLLVEPASTNLIVQSNDFASAAWVSSGNASVTSDQATGPDGETSMDLLYVSNASSDQHAIFDQVTASANVNITTSCYLKDNNNTYAALRCYYGVGNWATVVCNLSTGAITQQSKNGASVTIVDTNIEEVASGIYRLSLTTIHTATANPFMGINIVTSGTPTLDTNNGSEVSAKTLNNGFYIFGAQVEVGSVPTSPIITTGATATRAADDLRKALSALPYTASAASSAYVKFQVRVLSAQNVLEIANLVGGTGRYYVYLSSGATSPVRFFSNGGVADNTTPTISPNTDAKYAFAFDTNDFAHTLDGNTVETDATATLQSPQATVVFGQSNLAAQLNGLIKEVMILDERTSNTDLVSITT